MKKTLMLLTLVAGSSLITEAAWASQFAVQLEASKSPDLNRYASLSVHGKLYTVNTDNGYTRTRLGPYENKSKALEILEKVRAAGYADAFVARHDNGVSTSSAPAPAKPPAGKVRYGDIENFDVKTLKEWSMLTPEQQKNLVYLDGKLHIKDGNNFIPLHDIAGQQ